MNTDGHRLLGGENYRATTGLDYRRLLDDDFLGYLGTIFKSHAKTQRRNSRKLKIISRERNLLVEKWEESQSDSSVSWDSFISYRTNRSY